MIRVDITEKNGPFWTIVGTCSESLTPSGGLRIYRDAHSVIVRDCADDLIITKGRGLASTLQQLATESGMTIELRDETAGDALTVYAPENDAISTWTFFGHWENDSIAVEHYVPGVVADQRIDTGYWEQGLWAAAGSGATAEEAQAAAIAEYEKGQDA